MHTTIWTILLQVIPFSSDEWKVTRKPDVTKKTMMIIHGAERPQKNNATKSPLCGLNAYPRRSTDYTVLFLNLTKDALNRS